MLNTIEVLIYKALIDSHINNDEIFKYIMYQENTMR